ncbi:MAG: hypothetical protein ABI460_20795 [Caldimonas sp.]
MTAGRTKGLMFAAVAVAALQIWSPAQAGPSSWAAARSVRATDVDCGTHRILLLKGSSANAPAPAGSSGCRSSELTFWEVDISKALLAADYRKPFASSDVAARYIFCSQSGALIMLGSESQVEQLIRQFPAPPGCTSAKRSYRAVSSVGTIPFASAERKQMTVAESLAMHQKERNQVIADCNASPSCLADLRRMQSNSGRKIYTCPPGSTLQGSSDNPYATCKRY